MTAKLHKVRRAIAKSDLQRLIDKLNVERRECGADLIPSVDELRAEETHNDVFEFIKNHLMDAFDAGGGLATFGGDDEVADKAIDDSTKAIIKFFEERS